MDLQQREDDEDDAYLFGEDEDEEEMQGMEIVADLKDGDEPLNEEEDEDEDEDEDVEADTMMRIDCDSGEPEIVPLREDALDILSSHTAPVFALRALSRCKDGESVSCFASGSGDDTAVLWRMTRRYDESDGASSTSSRWQGMCLRGHHTDTISDLSFSFDGKTLATAGLDGKVVLWDVESGAYKRTLEGPGGAIEWMCWHPRGPVVLVGSEDFTSWMWNAETGSCMQVFSGHRAEVNCGCFTPDGKTVITAGMDATLRMWSPREGTANAVIEGNSFHTKAITAIDCHKQSVIVVSGSEDGMVCLSSVSTGKTIKILNKGDLQHSDAIESARFSPTSDSLFATGSLDGRVILWDLNSQTHRACLEHCDGITSLAWHPSAPLVATGSLDGIVRIWDVRNGSCVQELHGHRKSIHALEFMESSEQIGLQPSNSLLLSCSEDTTVRTFLQKGR